MDICSVNFYADKLGMQSDIDVLIPEDGKGPFPVLYLLHGLAGDRTSWRRNMQLCSTLGDAEVIIVMPNGARGYYVNNPVPGGAAYEDHIASDVVDFIERIFPADSQREKRMLAGYSMGGYGAFMLALKHPEKFGAAYSMSGAFYFAHQKRVHGSDYSNELALAVMDRDYDVFDLARRCEKSIRPALAFDCGSEDVLMQSNHAFDQHLKDLNYPHDFAEVEGEHSWDYWRKQFPSVIRFMRERFGI